ncbi:cadmium-induced protein AS8 isoform X4 [Punica granatum]|uniref:Cadmium-induced protein AS8 isoform X4 n=1 Tax=Punica granatum TaxID=22663 RepID=A0A6P8BPR9_PUNGR|nr:cadmium-induced protein AS8 isoform X4 [Punica granatum]
MVTSNGFIFFISSADNSVGMIIKGLLRRYERWNPVHPTIGAFWGMGFGFGCGVGWGPGLGPEVIGYVGAGCGVGFSVGFTMAGVGIGLPANYLFEVPYNEASRKLSNFKQQNFLSTRANLFVPLQSESAWKSLQTFSSHRFQPREGPRG